MDDAGAELRDAPTFAVSAGKSKLNLLERTARRHTAGQMELKSCRICGSKRLCTKCE